MATKIRDSREDRWFYSVNTIFLLFFGLITLYPLLYVLSSSFSSTDAIMSGQVWLWPVDFTLEGYKAVFSDRYILTGYKNTLFYATAGTLLNVFLTIIAAYPLSRKDFKHRSILMFAFTFTMIFHGGMIPTYMLISKLGLINNRLVMIIPGALTVYNVIITRSFYQNNIPDELLEAAQMDGCTDFKFMSSIVLPLSKPITAVITLFYAVEHWNSFFDAFLYITKKELYPLQLVLRDILVMNSIDASGMGEHVSNINKTDLRELLKYSLIVISTLPVMCMYPVVQKYFVQGVMIGAVKG